MDSILTNHSNNLFFRIKAADFSSQFNNDISVVLLQENELLAAEHEAIPKEDREWPVSYEYHADVIELILDNKPEALFIDLIFDSNTRPGKEALEDILKETDVPIYLGVGRDIPKSKNIYKEQISENIIPVSIVLDVMRDLKYPMTNIGSLEELTSIINDKYDTEFTLSLPAILYCYSNHRDKIDPITLSSIQIDDSKACLKKFITEHDSQIFYIAWNDMNGLKTGSPVAGKCKDLSQSKIIRFMEILSLNISNGFKSFFAINPNPANLQNCVTHQTISVNHLFYDPDRETVKNLLEDKWVFYSVHLNNTNDILTPPTHIAMPGVYAHAMALENFFIYKNNPIVEDKNLFQTKFISLSVVWTFLVSFLIVYINEKFVSLYQRKSLFKKKKQTNTYSLAFFFRPVVLKPIMLTAYLLILTLVIFYFAMEIPFQWFNMAPLSGFDFALAVGFINLPNFSLWWAEKLEQIGLGEKKPQK